MHVSLTLFMHIYLFSFMHFIANLFVYCYAWVKGEFLWSLTLIHAYILHEFCHHQKGGDCWPKGPVLMMINSCSYSTNDLVFNYSQICDQDLSRCLASTKDLKSSFETSTCWFKSLCIKTTSSTQEESSSLDQGLDQVKKEKKIFKWRPSREDLCLGLFLVRFCF